MPQKKTNPVILARIKRYTGQGCSAGVIAQRLGSSWTRNMVIGLARRHWDGLTNLKKIIFEERVLAAKEAADYAVEIGRRLPPPAEPIGEEDRLPRSGRAPTPVDENANPRVCRELECRNPKQPGHGFCATHLTSKFLLKRAAEAAQ